MDDDLREAGERFLLASQERDDDYSPSTEDGLAEVEEYLGRAIPPIWRQFLLVFGPGPADVRFGWPDSSGELLLRPYDAAEHQVETDDGHAIAAADGHVIGYIEGIGDCVTLDAAGVVQHHSHSGDEEALGSLAEVVDELARRLEEDDGVVIR